MTQEDLQRMVDKELEETLKKVERDKKKALKKEKEREAKQDVRTKMSVIASSTINADEELTLDKKTWDRLKKVDIEDAHKYISESEEDEDLAAENLTGNERKYRFFMDGKQNEEEKEDGEEERAGGLAVIEGRMDVKRGKGCREDVSEEGLG